MTGGLEAAGSPDAAELVGLLRAQTHERERRLSAGGSWTLTESIEHARLAAQVTLRCLQLAQGSDPARAARAASSVAGPRTAGSHVAGTVGTRVARTDGPRARPVGPRSAPPGVVRG